MRERGRKEGGREGKEGTERYRRRKKRVGRGRGDKEKEMISQKRKASRGNEQ